MWKERHEACLVVGLAKAAEGVVAPKPLGLHIGWPTRKGLLLRIKVLLPVARWMMDPSYSRDSLLHGWRLEVGLEALQQPIERSNTVALYQQKQLPSCPLPPDRSRACRCPRSMPAE